MRAPIAAKRVGSAHLLVNELLDLRSKATQCLLCNWFNEYMRFGERDQLSFAYVLHAQRPRPRVNLLPRRLHWSATVSEDTTVCFNATEEDSAQLALRYQHGRAGPTPMTAAQRQVRLRAASRAASVRGRAASTYRDGFIDLQL